jgi:tripartite-type tricarboxylate transporter receptor subunit TctC
MSIHGFGRTVFVLFATMLLSGPAAPQAYPSRPVKLIVPLGAGGATDLNARVLAEKLGERLGQPVVVENRPGAEGIIGVDAAAKSPADGYTLVLGSSTTLAANYSLRAKLPFDPVTDFTPVSMACSPQALSDLLAGQIQFVCEPVGTALPHIRAGKLRSLGVTSPTRLPDASELPTVAESGLPGFEYSAWVAVFAPAGVPREVVTKLDAEIRALLAQPDAIRRIQANGFDPMIGGPADLAALLKAEMARAVKVVRDAGIRPE